ncbi:LysM domain-containing protein, partial [Lactobacillus acidophilus]|nr:LysM domain-containing protein [Lactobacillus acidophilus]MCT3623982.1 LysM domain-containing protein [Lactobacillus acidophilus]
MKSIRRSSFFFHIRGLVISQT